MAISEGSLSPVNGRLKKKHSKALKIILSILLCILIALIVLFAINFKTIMLLFGNGNIKVKEIPEIKSALESTSMFSEVAESVNENGYKVLTSTSNDKAVKLTITEQKDGKKTVSAEVNANKIDASGIDTEGLKQGNPAAINYAKTLADKYVGTIIDKADITGMEAYITKSILSQYKSNPDAITIDHNFENTNFNLSGDLSTGLINITIKE